MNKKGQVNGFAMILIAFMAIIVGVVLFQVIAQEVGSSTNTVAVVNASLGAASNSTTVYLTDYRSISDFVIYNESGTEIIPASNYTVTNNDLDSDSALSVSVLPTTGTYPGFDGHTWTISGTAQPVTYIADSGGRAMAALIVVFFALAVAVVALEPTLRSGVLGALGK